MRTEKFVGRAGQEIAVQRANVDGPVRRVMNCIDKHQRAGFVREFRDLRDWVDGANSVGCVPDGDEFCFCGDFSPEIVEVQRAVGFANIDLPDDDTLFFQSAPRRDIGIMIQRGYDDLRVPRRT